MFDILLIVVLGAAASVFGCGMCVVIYCVWAERTDKHPRP